MSRKIMQTHDKHRLFKAQLLTLEDGSDCSDCKLSEQWLSV